MPNTSKTKTGTGKRRTTTKQNRGTQQAGAPAGGMTSPFAEMQGGNFGRVLAAWQGLMDACRHDQQLYNIALSELHGINGNWFRNHLRTFEPQTGEVQGTATQQAGTSATNASGTGLSPQERGAQTRKRNRQQTQALPTSGSASGSGEQRATGT